MRLARSPTLRAFDRHGTTTILARDGRALRFEGDSAGLVRAILDLAIEPRTIESLYAALSELAGAPVEPGGAVAQSVELLRSAGALVTPSGDAPRAAARAAVPRRVALAVSGGIAAAFAPLVVEALLERGHRVRCVATKNALRFTSALALEALTHEKVLSSMWPKSSDAPVNHLEIARWAELVVVCPATATTIGRIAQGNCEKLVSAVAIATRAPVLICPAMNEAMIRAPSVARNLEQLVADGFAVAHSALAFEVADDPAMRRPIYGGAPPVRAVVDLADALLAEHPRTAADAAAARWDEVYAARDPDALPWAVRGLEPDMAALLDRLAPNGGRLLDVGTGTGSAAVEAARRGFSVVATDVSARALAIARERAGDAAVTWLRDDMTKTRLASAFDVVFDRGCLHLLDADGRAAYAAAAKRLVRPGGVLLVKVHAQEEPVDRGTHRFELDELRELFEGFTLEESSPSTFEGPEPARSLTIALRRG